MNLQVLDAVEARVLPSRKERSVESCGCASTNRDMPTDLGQIDTHLTTDLDLVHAAKKGHTVAFEELVRRYSKLVFSIARHITRSLEDAEEVSQETFLKACLHLDEFEEKAQFSTWLTQIAVNAALTKIAGSDRGKVLGNEDPEWEPDSMLERVPDWRPNPEQLYSQSQLQLLLRRALEELPSAYSTVFLLRDMHGLSIAETAAALRVSIPTVKTRLLRARLQLRQNLSKSFIARVA